jgi:uncharacterized protein (TIGR00369 family)
MGALMAMDGGEAGEGTMIMHAIPGSQHGNPIGIVHGGFAATLLDSAMSCAVHTTLSAEETYVTTDLHVSFVRAITPATGRVTAHGDVVSRGRRLATARGTLVDANGKLLATGIATCMIMSTGA